MTEEQFFKSKYLGQDYDLPSFVQGSPNYHSLFEREYEIVRDAGKWGYIAEGDESPVKYDYDDFFDVIGFVEEKENCSIRFSFEIAKEIFGNQVNEKLHNDSNEYIKSYSKRRDKWYQIVFCEYGDSSVRVLVDSYQEWKKLDCLIDEDYFLMDNFKNIYNWLNTHPAFWIEERKGKHTNWKTDSGVSSLWAEPFEVSARVDEQVEKKEGQYNKTPAKIEWWIKDGEHVITQKNPEQYCSYYFYDEKLDASGSTYDEALINFAKNVWIQRCGGYCGQ